MRPEDTAALEAMMRHVITTTVKLEIGEMADVLENVWQNLHWSQQNAESVVYGLEGRIDERCRAIDSPTLRRHCCAWTQTRQTNGFIEAINGLFQAAKRQARGYARFETTCTVMFLIAGKLDFSRFNEHAR